MPFGPPEAMPFGPPEAMDELDAKVDKALAEGKRIKGNPAHRWTLPLGNKGYVLLATRTMLTRQGQRLKDLGYWSGPPPDPSVRPFR